MSSPAHAPSGPSRAATQSVSSSGVEDVLPTSDVVSCDPTEGQMPSRDGDAAWAGRPEGLNWRRWVTVWSAVMTMPGERLCRIAYSDTVMEL
jgi:hypothetical protein